MRKAQFVTQSIHAARQFMAKPIHAVRQFIVFVGMSF